MAKQNGLGDNFYIGGFDLSGDIASLKRIGGGPDTLEVTGIDKSANERIGGKRDGLIEFTSFFNKSAGQEHPKLSLLPTADQVVTYCRGTAIGNASACLTGKQINYDGQRNAKGDFTFEVQAQANGFGLEWGKLLTAGKRTDVGATNGIGVDHLAASAFGLQAYLQVFSFTGTNVVVKLQESSDNGVGDAWTDVVGGAFTQITVGPTSQRIATGAIAVERYLRAVTTTAGGFTNLVFSVTVVKNETAVAF